MVPLMDPMENGRFIMENGWFIMENPIYTWMI